ncbi:Alcohol dehydrogenase 2 [Aeromonas salmonicida]|uniref:iron-containing alcohol dehydrogenase n=1 Tax=Aeromonas salmonicida TaxID=645 RepID=UPI0011181B1D|nr:iron-containing alcohol dehydrogenase [Aeromonas salmonicida]TNI76947.1 L-threonine dehydrogenase [Aeromonas salmonicida]
MATFKFYIPAINLMGAGCLQEAAADIKGYGYRKALIVTDKILNQIGVVAKLTTLLAEHGIESVVFDETKPNPTMTNVESGLAMIRANGCDCVISLGGGSPHDCAKGIALVAANGGSIQDYEGVDRSAKPQLPLIAIIDKHVTPLMSVNDPELMLAKPAGLTAATGMDALTHAIEAYVSTIATPVTDASAIMAIQLIAKHLRTAVNQGDDLHAREQMAYAQFLAGMAFNNASLGYVHAMAHQLGGFYDLPHGVCNAVLLPHVQAYNAQVNAARLKDVARYMGVDVSTMNDEQGAAAAIAAIKQLALDVKIPAGLEQLGVKADDFDVLASNALKDACGFTNPKQASHEEIVAIFRAAM